DRGQEATTTDGRSRGTVRAAAKARMDLRIDDEGQAAALPGLLSSWSPSVARGNESMAAGHTRVRQTARCRDGGCGGLTLHRRTATAAAGRSREDRGDCASRP